MDEPSGVKRAPGPLVPLARQAVAAVARRWHAFTGGCLASLILALVLSSALATQSWEASGTLLYTPPQAADNAPGLYKPPDLKTLSSLVESPENLEAIRREFHLETPLKVLAKNFDVTVPSGSRSLVFSLRWGDGKTAAEMVNRLMEVFRSQVVAVRNGKLAGLIKDLNGYLDVCKQRSETVATALHRFKEREKVTDINQELLHLFEEILLLESQASKSERDGVNFKTQLRTIDKQLKDLKDQEHREQKEGDKDGAQETIADSRRRQDRLRELIAEERARLGIEATLAAKKNDLDRALSLAAKGYAHAKEIQDLRAEVAALEARVKDTGTIEEWKAELDRLDKSIVPKGPVQTQATMIMDRINFKRLELELERTAVAEESQQIKFSLEQKRKQVDRLGTLEQRYRALQKDVDTADLERIEVDNELAQLRKLQSITTPEFTVVIAATPAPYAASSTRKLILACVGAGGILLTVAVLVGFDQITSATLRCERAVRGLGLPVLARLTVPPGSLAGRTAALSDNETLRLLALRLRQVVDKPNSLILLSSLNVQAGSAWLAAPLARCLARRDERVLICDLVGNPADQPALADLIEPEGNVGAGAGPRGLQAYLDFECIEPDEVIVPTSIPGVDCLPSGTSQSRVDALGTHWMQELLTAIRARYTLVLAIGPAADQQADLEMMAARADGILFDVHDQGGRCLDGSGAVRNLIERGGAVLGAVIAQTADGPEVMGRHGAPLAARGRRTGSAA